jgi:hypothetical protein
MSLARVILALMLPLRPCVFGPDFVTGRKGVATLHESKAKSRHTAKRDG